MKPIEIIGLVGLCFLAGCDPNSTSMLEEETAKKPGGVYAAVTPVEGSVAKQPEKTTGCADSKGIKPEVDFVMGKGQETNVLNVAFVQEQPSAKEVDRILRACVEAAVQLDDTRDILGTAWFRRSSDDNPLDDEIISNYGPLKYLSYQASSKSIEVRKIDFGDN